MRAWFGSIDDASHCVPVWKANLLILRCSTVARSSLEGRSTQFQRATSVHKAGALKDNRSDAARRTGGITHAAAEEVLCLGLCRRGPDPGGDRCLGSAHRPALWPLRFRRHAAARGRRDRRSARRASPFPPPCSRSSAPITSPGSSTATARPGSTPAACSCAPCPIRRMRSPSPRTRPTSSRILDWCDAIGATVIPYGGGSSVVKGIEPTAAFDRVVTISLRADGQGARGRSRQPGGAHRGRRLRARTSRTSSATRPSPCATTCRPIAARRSAAGSRRARAATTPRSTPTSTISSKACGS